MKTIQKNLSVRPGQDGEVRNLIRRTWRRRTSGPLTVSVMKMSKRNYKVYADIGVAKISTLLVCAILDNGAGPNFIHRDKLPTTGSKIKPGQGPIIIDATGRPVNIVGKVSIYVRFG